MSIAEKLTTVAENIPKVYEAGYFKGQRDGWEEGNTEGWINGRAEYYNEFWDSYVGLTSFVSMFAGRMWNDTTFKPKNDIVAKGQANQLFYNNGCSNIKQSLINCGVELDLSQATQANQAFWYCYSLELPEINLSNATRVQGTFQDARRLVTIDKVTFKDDVTFQNTFYNIPTLENITIGGTIGGSGFDIHWSTKLSAKSLYSIINALSTSATGLTVTLPTTAEANYNANPPSGAPQTWAQLVATRQNWSIAYA